MNYIFNDFSAIPALRTAAELHNMALSESERVRLVADMGWAYPFGMLVTANAIRSSRNSHPNNEFFMLSNDAKDAVSYAKHMGFFKSISEFINVGNAPGEAIGNDNYIPITKIDLNQLQRDSIDAGHMCEIEESIEIESRRLSKILCHSNVESQNMMTYLIREMLRNIPEHAGVSEAWICGQYWNNGTAEIAILDNGIGITESLQKNSVHRSYITDDTTALQCAIKAGISQSFSPSRGNHNLSEWANSGFGLFMVSEICKKLSGDFCIASGDSYIYITSDGDKREGKTYINGTAIMMKVSTSELHSCNELIREVSSLGEIQARTIKNAFKKASKPSKGLVIGTE